MRPTQLPIRRVPALFPCGKAGRALNTHFHTVPKLRMGGVTPLLLLYAFMAWTEKILPLPLAK
jgi:hypothetical protein